MPECIRFDLPAKTKLDTGTNVSGKSKVTRMFWDSNYTAAVTLTATPRRTGISKP